MKIYIAGGVTGVPNYKEIFAKYEKNIGAYGDSIMNPTCLPENMKNEDYMRICLSMVDSCDLLVLLPGHTKSKGAEIERLYALYIGRYVYDCEQKMLTGNTTLDPSLYHKIINLMDVDLFD